MESWSGMLKVLKVFEAGMQFLVLVMQLSGFTW